MYTVTMTRTVLQIVIAVTYCEFVTGTNCRDGWVAYHNSCYWFARNHKSSFTEAEHYCRQHESNLVQIETKAENLFLKNYLSGLKDEDHWIGLTDEAIEAVWKWYTSDADATYTDWHPSEPNSYHGNEEDCAIYSFGEGYRWADVPCTSSFEPICEAV